MLAQPGIFNCANNVNRTFGLAIGHGDLAWGFAPGLWPEALAWGFGLGICSGDFSWGFALGIWPGALAWGFGLGICLGDVV